MDIIAKSRWWMILFPSSPTKAHFGLSTKPPLGSQPNFLKGVVVSSAVYVFVALTQLPRGHPNSPLLPLSILFRPHMRVEEARQPHYADAWRPHPANWWSRRVPPPSPASLFYAPSRYAPKGSPSCQRYL